MSQPIHTVTGAFGFTGKYIARRLLDRGYAVRTLTGSPHRENPFGDRVLAHPFNFDRPDRLAASLAGVQVLYNTYWVRFNHKAFSFARALQNSMVLFEAARKAGVERIVHISITNPSLDSELEYFRGKAALEQALVASGISYAILRPAVLYGQEDILINNIAWALRRFPVFGVFGDGNYGIQPIYVDDIARLAVDQGADRENRIIDAVGPETFTYKTLVRTIGRIIGHDRPIISVSPRTGYLLARVIGWMVGDTFLTREEIKGLMAGNLSVDAPPVGDTRLTEWVRANANRLGRRYASEMARRIGK